ncbi:Zinc/iron permease [Lentinus tigrinus ALCF2SS1-6]|uniref:Zinc/iron permease n=1 Tax=Lentinus tigrinus ALCF2SS1-6 TaxID=1328759 RepID=A0A5C2SGQ2_9APHY|nr:Zinc/iron permease [Lentinus tigrinus ALCF2SS1-6]
MGFAAVFLMAALLGAASYGTGLLPLTVAFSRNSLAALTTYGTGLLLGAALGVVIPEGVETLVSSTATPAFATPFIGLSLVAGFIFMLAVERLFSHPAHDTLPSNSSATQQHRPANVSSVEFDVELGELEREQGIPGDSSSRPPVPKPVRDTQENQRRALPLTLGLVVHALADGLALGSAALSESAEDAAAGAPESLVPSGLSIIVFLALAIHKAPTALALTTSLLATDLPVADCKRHLAMFSASTPVGTLLSYAVLSFFGTSGHSRWPGVTLLFSGGSFLYVAAVLQPSLAHGSPLNSAGGESLTGRAKTLLTIGGMVTPYLISLFLGDDQGHA